MLTEFLCRRESFNCKVEGECVALEEQFLCRDGLCQNISRIMSCDHTEVGAEYDWTDKRNCILLTSLSQFWASAHR